jgi:hypothetical protein
VSAGSQSWYLTDTAASATGADYRAFRGGGSGTTNTLNLAKLTSKVWVAAFSSADEASNIECRMNGTWSASFYTDGEGNSNSSYTLDIGILTGGTFTSYGTSAEQTAPKAGGTQNFNVTVTGMTVSPGEYLAMRINNTSTSKGFDLDVLGSPDSPSYVTSPSGADDYPGTETISFTLADYGTTGIDFGSLNAGTNDNPADQGTTTGTVTLQIGSETNVDVIVQLKGTDFSDGGTNTIAVTNVKYDDDNSPNQGGGDTGESEGSLTTSYATWYSVSAYTADNTECFHWISIPTPQAAGDYTSTFTYQAIKQ